MSYIDEGTLWRFTVPQAGEVDSAESVDLMVRAVDSALISPMAKAELVSGGASIDAAEYIDGDTSTYSTQPDAYWSEQEGGDVYVTRRHFHPTPNRVPNADYANEAGHAESATSADWAGRLNPGFTLNGILITGESGDGVTPPSHVLHHDDIPDAPRVFWGSGEPVPGGGMVPARSELRRGDIYIKVI